MDSFLRPFDILHTMDIFGYITYYVFVAALTTGFLLAGLVLWHGGMISLGVTSLERVLHKKYAKQCYEQGFIFVNPYDFGFLENWKRFLGVRTIGEFIRRVLWPSTHKPEGNGITWDGYNVNTNLQSPLHGSRPRIRPAAFPPGIYPYSVGSYPINRCRSVVPPWEMQRKLINVSNIYQPRAPSTETIDLKKAH